tara:strand:+ start:118 stop:645 length:528 start_codon:yes stop_codon:yes gene_type:complete
MSFYRVPDNIINPIAERNLVSGRIVLPLDIGGQLEQQLNSLGHHDCIRADNDTDYLDPSWWKSLPTFDWTLAITQGVRDNVQWIIEPGYELAKRGLIILDRLTFLEPTRTRSAFLLEKSLSNLIVLNPRPIFRADQSKTKDSVTSAWMVYNKAKSTDKGTNIDFDVSWQRPKSFL